MVISRSIGVFALGFAMGLFCAAVFGHELGLSSRVATVALAGAAGGGIVLLVWVWARRIERFAADDRVEAENRGEPDDREDGPSRARPGPTRREPDPWLTFTWATLSLLVIYVVLVLFVVAY